MKAADPRICQALEALKSLEAPKGARSAKGLGGVGGLGELGERTRIVVSPLWAGAGGSAILGRVNLPAWAPGAPRWRLAGLLAHELVHVRQGIRFFGSIDTEREAFLVQRRVEIELLTRQRPRPDGEIARRRDDIRVLESGFAPAREWVVKQGPMYARFPDKQPRWWQVTRWWPQVGQAIRLALASRRSGGGAA